MSFLVILILTGGAAMLLALELRGFRTTLSLGFRGDIKRETAFLAQYGQSVATPLAAWFVHVARSNWHEPLAIVASVVIASLLCTIIKRLSGRMRPNRENAGKFTGFSMKHDNQRESFPSSHSACAVALTITMIQVWPEAAAIFWTLAILTALLRYLLDAHFPSDVLAGCLLGYVVAGSVYVPIRDAIAGAM